MVSLQGGRSYGFSTSALTGPLIRAGRALARLSAAELADEAGVSIVTVKRAEATDGTASFRDATATALINALARRGVIFVEADGVAGAGVRLTLSAERQPA